MGVYGERGECVTQQCKGGAPALTDMDPAAAAGEGCVGVGGRADGVRTVGRGASRTIQKGGTHTHRRGSCGNDE
jgi:hypothetical protein